MKNKVYKVLGLDPKARAYTEIESKRVYVDGALSGEKVCLGPVFEYRKEYRAQLSELSSASPDRVSAECPYFGTCGGCQLQHLDYSAALLWKQRLFEAKFAFKADIFYADPYNYRSRIQLKRGPQNKWGFYRKNSRHVIDIESCAIASPAINIFLSNPDNFAQIPDHIKEIELIDEAGEITIIDRIDGSFSQVNAQMNQILKEHLNTILANLDFDKALELFAGSGNLTEIIARHCKQLKTIESDPAGLDCIKSLDMKGHSLAKIESLCADVFSEINFDYFENYDLVLLDPPRSGATKIMQAILRMKPKYVVYISCHLDTLHKDLYFLTQNAAYQIKKAELFDFFPQTYHIETMMILERNHGCHSG